MSDDGEQKPDESPSRRSPLGGDAPLIQPKKQSFFSSLWSSFMAGVVVVAPVGITVWVFYLLLTGPMAKLDAFVKRAGERLIESVPIVRNVFGFFKNVFETALRQSDRSFKEVALVEYPRKGAWVMAFVVGETKGEVLAQLNDMGDALTSIFVPTVPNPTSGFLIFVPRSELRILKMSVEEAAKVVFSLGLVVPAYADGDEAVQRLEALADEARKEKAPLRKRLFGSKG